MADAVAKVFDYLYFKPTQSNGKDVKGKFEPLKVRFLYASMESIQLGRVHMYEYSPKKYSKVLCLRNGLRKDDLEKTDCPLCDKETWGTPAPKYFAFVQDMNDDGKLKLLEMNYSLGKAIDEIADYKGLPLNDMIFTLIKKGVMKDTTYLAMFEEKSPCNVGEYFESLGLKDYPAIVGLTGERTPVTMLTHTQIVDFIGGKYPWSTGEGSTQRKSTLLGATVTTRGESAKAELPAEAEDIVDMKLPEADESANPDDDSVFDDKPKTKDSFF